MNLISNTCFMRKLSQKIESKFKKKKTIINGNEKKGQGNKINIFFI